MPAGLARSATRSPPPLLRGAGRCSVHCGRSSGRNRWRNSGQFFSKGNVKKSTARCLPRCSSGVRSRSRCSPVYRPLAKISNVRSTRRRGLGCFPTRNPECSPRPRTLVRVQHTGRRPQPPKLQRGHVLFPQERRQLQLGQCICPSPREGFCECIRRIIHTAKRGSLPHRGTGGQVERSGACVGAAPPPPPPPPHTAQPRECAPRDQKNSHF
eukprot:gene14776-biopygen15695